MKRNRLLSSVAVIAVTMVVWGPCVPTAHAKPQGQPVEPEKIGILLDVVVTQTAGEQENAETPESRTWRITAMTTSGRHVRVQNVSSRLSATPFQLDDGRIAVEFTIRAFVGSDTPMGILVIDAAAEEAILEDDEPTIVTALTDAGGTVEVTLTATAGPGV